MSTNIPEKAIQALTSLLVASQRYTVQVATHKADCTFVSMRKALVKDMSKYVDRIDKKMPIGYILTFSEFEIILLVESIERVTIGVSSLTLVMPTYEITLCRL